MQRYSEFKKYWVTANLNVSHNDVKASEINRILHQDRIKNGVKVTFKAKPKDLPDGVFFSDNNSCTNTSSNSAYMICGNRIYLWSFEGYTLQDGFNSDDELDIITPRSIVNAFRLGFKPGIHNSMDC